MRLAAGALVALMATGAWAQTAEEPTEGGTAQDGTPLLLPGQDADIDTDVEVTGEGLRMDGTVPQDASPTPGGDGAAAEGDVSAPIETDASIEGEAMAMDGTVPVDESPEAEAD
jgi:hypothetical protein